MSSSSSSPPWPSSASCAIFAIVELRKTVAIGTKCFNSSTAARRTEEVPFAWIGSTGNRGTNPLPPAMATTCLMWMSGTFTTDVTVEAVGFPTLSCEASGTKQPSRVVWNKFETFLRTFQKTILFELNGVRCQQMFYHIYCISRVLCFPVPYAVKPLCLSETKPIYSPVMENFFQMSVIID